MYKWLVNRLTKKQTKIPLFWVNFNLKKYRENGAEGSCMMHLHPVLRKDDIVKDEIEYLIDYIRKTYDMEDLSL